jgi:hypothetical protein
MTVLSLWALLPWHGASRYWDVLHDAHFRGAGFRAIGNAVATSSKFVKADQAGGVLVFESKLAPPTVGENRAHHGTGATPAGGQGIKPAVPVTLLFRGLRVRIGMHSGKARNPCFECVPLVQGAIGLGKAHCAAGPPCSAKSCIA